MHYPKARTDLTPEVVAPLTEALERIGIHDIANQLWETELSPAEQERLGEDFPLRRLPEAYAAFRGISFERAVLDLGVAADVVTLSRRHLLLKQLGEGTAEEAIGPTMLPSFDLATGELRLGNGECVEFEIREAPTNRYRVLEAFQLAGWASVVENPLCPAKIATGIRQVVQELKKKVPAIDFSTQAGGTQVCWKYTPEYESSNTQVA